MTSEHSGTHLDAPAHFAKDHWSVDQIPAERFIAPGKAYIVIQHITDFITD